MYLQLKIVSFVFCLNFLDTVIIISLFNHNPIVVAEASIKVKILEQPLPNVFECLLSFQTAFWKDRFKNRFGSFKIFQIPK